MNMSESVKAVKIDLLIQQPEKSYPLYIKIGGKLIKYIDGSTGEDLQALKLRGVTEVFLTLEDFEKFKLSQCEIQNFELNREHNLSKEVVRSYVKEQEELKCLFMDVGFEKEKIEKINSLNKKTLNIIEKTDSLKELFQAFQDTNETSIIKKQMEIYLSIEMVRVIFQETELVNLDNYISQMTRALLVSDLLLTEEEYWESYSKSPRNLSPKILNHGTDIIKQLPSQDFLTTPFVTLIRDHHETPDGQGYPSRRNCTSLNQFTSIYLIAEAFISRFIKGKMKINIIQDLMDEVNQEYKKYLNPNMEKALKSFNVVMRNEKDYFMEVKV